MDQQSGTSIGHGIGAHARGDQRDELAVIAFVDQRRLTQQVRGRQDRLFPILQILIRSVPRAFDKQLDQRFGRRLAGRARAVGGDDRRNRLPDRFDKQTLLGGCVAKVSADGDSGGGGDVFGRNCGKSTLGKKPVRRLLDLAKQLRAASVPQRAIIC